MKKTYSEIKDTVTEMLAISKDQTKEDMMAEPFYLAAKSVLGITERVEAGAQFQDIPMTAAIDRLLGCKGMKKKHTTALKKYRKRFESDGE